MKAQYMQKFGKRAAGAAVTAALALCGAAAVLGLTACEKDETPQMTLTVVCTDDVRQSLADRGVTDAAGWLQAAADEFAAGYEGAYVKIEVVQESASVMAANLAAAQLETQTTTVTGVIKQAFADEPDPNADEPAALMVAEGADEGAESADDEEPAAAEPPADEPVVTAAEPVAAPASGGASAKGEGPTQPFAPADPMHPDVLFGAYGDISAAIYTGAAVPVDDMITADMQAQIPAAYLAAGTSPADGRTYLLPYSAHQTVLVFDADLFAACGLDAYIVERELPADEAGEGEDADAASDTAAAAAQTAEPLTARDVANDALSRAVVQNWTPEQWLEVLTTLAARLPVVSQERLAVAVDDWSVAVELARLAAEEAGEDPDAAAAQYGEQPQPTPLYPMMMFGAGENGGNYTAALMRMFGSDFFDEDGFFLLETPEGEAAIQWLNWANGSGFFPSDAGKLTYANCADLFANGQLGIFAIDSRDIPDLILSAVKVPEKSATEGAASVVTDQIDKTSDEAGRQEQTSEETGEPEEQITLTRHYGYVTIPVWDAAVLQAMLNFNVSAAVQNINLALSEDADAVAQADPEPFASFVIGGAGEDGAAEDGAAANTASGYGAVVPLELTGFCVLDNGDDLRLKIAREFVSYVLSSDKWLAYAATTTEFPANAATYAAFADRLTLGTYWQDLTSYAVNLSANTAGWNSAVKALPATVVPVLSGAKTPVEAAAFMDLTCNPAILGAYYQAKIHA